MECFKKKNAINAIMRGKPKETSQLEHLLSLQSPLSLPSKLLLSLNTIHIYT